MLRGLLFFWFGVDDFVCNRFIFWMCMGLDLKMKILNMQVY